MNTYFLISENIFFVIISVIFKNLLTEYDSYYFFIGRNKAIGRNFLVFI